MVFPKTELIQAAIKTRLGIDVKPAGFKIINGRMTVEFKSDKASLRLFATGANALVEGRRIGGVMAS